MFNSFSWKLREVSGSLSSPTQSHPSAPGMVAEGGRTQKSAAEMAMARRYSKDAQRCDI